MREWRLKDLTIDGKGSYGIAAPAVDYSEDLYTYLRITDINDDGTLNHDGLKSVDDPDAKRFLLKENDIVFARTGNSTGRTYFYEPQDGKFVYAGFLIKFSLDPCKVEPRMLKYYTHTEQYYNWIRTFDSGATRGNINAQTYANMPIALPDLPTQRRISSILSSLDAKIETNRKINEKLEAMAQALFKSSFIDFEPFKGGKFVESELGMIPEGWRVGKLTDVCVIYDKLRKPLSAKERELMDKIYPYYGATSIMDYVDNYIFDGIYLLMGEDGSVANEQGYPFIQYVWGKFWPNNHAHVLQGKNGYTVEMLCTLLKQTNISHLVTGAVQAKLNQANMAKIRVIIPPENICNNLNDIMQPIFSRIRSLTMESTRLANLRDTLLPKLMSGEIEV